MVKKKVLIIWFASNAILSLYFILRRIQLANMLREQEEEKQTFQEHMQPFERRYADFSSINEHGVAQKNKVQQYKKTTRWQCTFRIYKKTLPKTNKEFPMLDNTVIKWLGRDFLSYENTLFKDMHEVADDNKRFFLIYVDKHDVDLALNIQLVNFDQFKIQNYLFIAADRETMINLRAKNMECFLFSHVIQKHDKFKIIFLALLYGFNPILSDTNMIFLQNPTTHLTYDNYDIAMMQDDTGKELNEAFGIIYATESTINFFKQRAEKLALSTYTTEESSGNIFSNDQQSKIKIAKLDSVKFQSGTSYYLEGRHEFFEDNNTCTACVAVHNSGIQTKAARIYRLKEGLKWEAEDPHYFDNPEAKYMTYENDFTGEDIAAVEEKALKAAFVIAVTLNRILILPKLNCKGFKCNILHRYKIEALETFLRGKYRESAFLHHSFVPDSIRNGHSPKLKISPLNEKQIKRHKGHGVQTFLSTTLDDGYLDIDEIKRWIIGSRWNLFPVLHFQSLNFEVRGFNAYLIENVEKGLCKSDYLQSAECSGS